MKNGRNITRNCKECGKPFKEKTRKTQCQECNSKKAQIISKITWEKNKEEKKEWQNKITTTITDQPEKEKWNYDTREPSTNNKCTTCNDYHYKNEKYDHQYTQKKPTKCLKLTDITRLMIEYEQEKDLKGTESLRYLNRKGLLEE